MKCLRSLFLLAVVTLHSALFAQVGKPRTDLAIGGSAGMVLNRVSFNPSIKQSMKPGMTLGFTARYTGEKYFSMICAFQGELNYTQSGWKENISTSSDTYQRTVHYVQVPLLAHLGFGRERGGVKAFLVIEAWRRMVGSDPGTAHQRHHGTVRSGGAEEVRVRHCRRLGHGCQHAKRTSLHCGGALFLWA